LATAATASAAGWSAPFRIAAPAALDVIPAQIAFSATGDAAVGYGVQDEDNPANSDAFTTSRSARGRLAGSRRIADAQQVLALAYDGRALELLTGTSPNGDACCSSVSAVGPGRGGGFGSAQRIVSGLSGATVAQLVAVPTGLLAAIASEHGVWVAQSPTGGRFGRPQRLTASGALPESMDATSLRNGQSVVAWTARQSSAASGPDKVFVATGTPKAAPRRARAAITVPAGHRIDELAVAAGPGVPTVAWTESWFDVAGTYHSQAFVTDLRQRLQPRPLSAPVELAAGLTMAGDAAGDEAVAWKGCTTLGDCAVRAALRPARGRFSNAVQLPAIDASQDPAVAVSPKGVTLVGWIQHGHVLAARASRRATAFGPVAVVSATNYAADLALAFGPGRQALAAWTQGTLAQSLIGAVFTTS
jgi:hypothetical protein